jgi:hypothetical protein
MCWNATVSINTYIFGLFACIFAYMNNVISLSTLLFNQSFMVMQLIEYLIWSKKFSNKILSQIAYISVLSQPIVGILTIDKPQIKNIGLALYFIFLIALFIINPWSSIDFRSIPAANGHLAWHWMPSALPILIVWMLFLSLRMILNKDWIAMGIVYFLVIVSYILYNKTLTAGSFWCWISNFIAIFFIYKVFAKEFCSI